MSIDLTDPIYNDEDAAWAHFEAIRWPHGPMCAHCGSVDSATKLAGKSTRKGVYKCKDCRKPFTATLGTVYERSHIPMHKWMLATHLMAASKKGMSAHQLFRMLGFGSYRTAWFMAHRIREAMTDTTSGPLGGEGKTVEVDETFLGQQGYQFNNDKGWQQKRGYGDKMKIVTLVERKGRARSIKVETMKVVDIRQTVFANLHRESHLMTDEANHYRRLGKQYVSHETVNHAAKEFGRGNVHTNTIEGFFSILKRGMKGVYQHCSEQHLHRYLAEFDFRYSNRIALKVDDTERARRAVAGAVGKRLMYVQSSERAAA